MRFVPTNPKCPLCDMLLNGATAIDGTGDAPSPGDVTVCVGCFTCLRFTADMQLEFQPMGTLSEDEQREVVVARMKLESFMKMMRNL